MVPLVAIISHDNISQKSEEKKIEIKKTVAWAMELLVAIISRMKIFLKSQMSII